MPAHLTHKGSYVMVQFLLLVLSMEEKYLALLYFFLLHRFKNLPAKEVLSSYGFTLFFRKV